MDSGLSQPLDIRPQKQNLPPLSPQDIQVDGLICSSNSKRNIPVTIPETNIKRQKTLAQYAQTKQSTTRRQQQRFDRFYSPIIKGKKFHSITFRDLIEKENGLIDVFDYKPIIVQTKDNCCNIQ